MNQLKAVIMDTLTQFWDERQVRERQIIIIALVTLALLLFYSIAIDPALSGRDEVRKSLPNLFQQSAQMQRMAQEYESLPSKENMHEASREFVDGSLNEARLKAESVSVQDGVVRLQFPSISMAALQTWLLAVQKSAGLFVDEIKITGIEDGLVKASVTLRRPSNGS
jgi:general secretion pathway protein M